MLIKMNVDQSTEILRLRATVRDLLALSIIPEAWVGREPLAVAADLAVRSGEASREHPASAACESPARLSTRALTSNSLSHELTRQHCRAERR